MGEGRPAYEQLLRPIVVLFLAGCNSALLAYRRMHHTDRRGRATLLSPLPHLRSACVVVDEVDVVAKKET